MADRQRKVNIDKLSEEEFEGIIKALSDKVTKMTDETCEKANKLLNVYGVKAKMQISFESLEKEQSHG